MFSSSIGAAYHKAAGTMEMLERLRVPITQMGPYSYDAAPCELFFAAFKKADINPNKIPLGKTHFQQVVQLVVERCRQIPMQHIILNWHHCLQFIFGYLTFTHI